jgi:hypothetical protein
MRQTSSKDTIAYKHGVARAKDEHNKDCPYVYGTIEYWDWWQGYDDVLRDTLAEVLEQERST